MATILKSTKKERIGWYIYDWANSAFSTTVVTVFMGPYLSQIASNAATDGYVYPFGIKVFVEALYPYIVSLSVALQVLLLPFIGAIIDQYGYKKQMLAFFAILGSLATISLFNLQGTNYIYGSLVFLVANLSFGASMVAYNSFLADIAEEKWRDKVSSIGWGVGYLGGGLLLLINLIIFSNAESLFSGNPKEMAIRISIASAGVWWLLFSFFPLYRLKNSNSENRPEKKNLLANLNQLIRTIRGLKHNKNILFFILAFIFYNEGVQAVVVMAAQFAQRELGISSETIIVAILMVQFVAFLGAISFINVAREIGSQRTIYLLIGIWITAIFFAYFFLDTVEEFFLLGALIALGMGGIQSLSRSLFSKLVPQNRQGEFFGIYELSEKGSSLLGPMAFALAMEFTHSYRFGILSLAIFFVIGIVFLRFVKTNESAT